MVVQNVLVAHRLAAGFLCFVLVFWTLRNQQLISASTNSVTHSGVTNLSTTDEAFVKKTLSHPIGFITFNSTQGFNNQREVLRVAFFLCLLLNRTLLLPPKRTHIHSEFASGWASYYNLPLLRQVVPVVEVPNVAVFDSGKLPMDFLFDLDYHRTVLTDVEESDPEFRRIRWLADRASKQYDKYGPLNIVHIASLRRLIKEPSERKILLLPFVYCWIETFFIVSKRLRAHLDWVERTFLKFNDDIIEHAKTISADTRNEFDAVHYRVGDKSHRIFFQPDLTRDVLQNHKQRKVYVATNSAVHPRIVHLRQELHNLGVESFVYNDFHKDNGSVWLIDNDRIQAVEQVLCSLADSFFPTVESSMSEQILYFRKWNGKDPNGTALDRWYNALRVPNVLHFLLRENRDHVDLTSDILRHIQKGKQRAKKPSKR